MAASKPRILILAGAGAAAFHQSLEAVGLEAVQVSKPAEAVSLLRETPFALVVVDAALPAPPVSVFLEKIRDFLPATARAVFEENPLPGLDLRALINRCEPCAIFTGAASAAEVPALLERLARRGAPPSPTPPRGPVPAAPAAPRVQPEPGPAAFRFPAAADPAAPPPPPPACLAMPESFVPPAHANRKLELDLMLDDRTAEVARLLDLLLEEPDVQLPVLPQVASEVRKLLAREDVAFEKIAEVVSLDPSMSARILEVANSPLYSGVEKIKNLQQAVSRIGMQALRNILQAVSAEKLFKATDKRLSYSMATLWMHSLGCAYSNEILAQDLAIEESSDFFMMGLLHDIGKLLILHLIQTGNERRLWSRQTITDDLLSELLQRHHNRLGARLLEKWGYDRAFQEVVYLHNSDGNIHEHKEAVVVTYYSNLLTRKMGFSLLPYPQEADPLGRHDIAQALNMGPDVRDRVEASLRATVLKIKESYL